MSSPDESLPSWDLVERVETDGVRRLFVRAPGLKSKGGNTDIAIQRSGVGRFLTSTGWVQSKEVIAPTGVYARGEDLLVEIPDWVDPELEAYEIVNCLLFGGDQRGAVVWDAKQIDGELRRLERESPKPFVEAHELRPAQGATASEAANTSVTTPGTQAPRADEQPLKKDGPTQQGGGSVGTTSGGTIGGGTTGGGTTGGGPPPRSRTLLWVIIALLVAGALVALYLYLGREGDAPVGPSTTPQPGAAPADPNSNSNSNSGSNSPATVANELEDFRTALEAQDFERARALEKSLVAKQQPEAARLAAERAGGPQFAPGLYDERNDALAYDLFRIACTGDPAAKESLGRWIDALKAEQKANGAAQQDLAELTDVVAPALLAQCGATP